MFDSSQHIKQFRDPSGDEKPRPHLFISFPSFRVIQQLQLQPRLKTNTHMGNPGMVWRKIPSIDPLEPMTSKQQLINLQLSKQSINQAIHASSFTNYASGFEVHFVSFCSLRPAGKSKEKHLQIKFQTNGSQTNSAPLGDPENNYSLQKSQTCRPDNQTNKMDKYKDWKTRGKFKKQTDRQKDL